MLGLYWEHPPALDPEVVGNMMEFTLDRIRGLEDWIQALLAEQKDLIFYGCILVLFSNFTLSSPHISVVLFLAHQQLPLIHHQWWFELTVSNNDIFNAVWS
ncbi:hypothetical protein L1987_29131 [Smallanthus sonchifolius]|uniref:Uncharacterized protein n=1 Tax=Smallanthus sonchifolius TaxID=185202 RepID=A0ACB9HZ66_9ASTR|nr:hypothetical protein L1987_29131 [Smallanthus sonchifolius]